MLLLEKENLEYIIKYALSLGIEYIEINSVKREIITDNISMLGKSSSISCENGTSLIFYYNNMKYVISTSNVENIKLLCKNIEKEIHWNSSKNQKNKNIDFKLNKLKEYKNVLDFNYVDENRYTESIKEFCDIHPKIINLNIPLLYEKKETCIANSNGKYVIKNEYHYKIDILMSATLNGKTRFNYFSQGSSSFNNLLKNINIEQQFKILYSSLEKMNSKEKFRKKLPVVLSNGIGGVIIHESCGHSLESREIIKEKSILNSYKHISNPILTVIDDPTLNNLFGSSQIDDEGNETHKIELINKGKIENYLVDNEGSKILAYKRNSSGRRESYYNLMSSRMSNTYIYPGNSNFNEIISSIKYGIYVKNITGGVVDTISGNFSFNCLESYFINNGKIDYSKAFDNLSIIGNTVDILKNISMIGNDLKHSCGICGSESGFIFTTVGQPTIKIEEILVEGQ